MKKAKLVILTMLLSSFLHMDVPAKQTFKDTDAQIVQTFCQDSNLYAYVDIPMEKENSTLVSNAVIDNVYTYKQAKPITKVVNASEPVSYLFLIDISTSMPQYAENIETFVSEFMSVAGANASYAIATFGSKFEITCDFTKNQNDAKATLEETEYNVKQTSLYTSIINVIDFYKEKERQEGKLFNIIIVSDGIEYDKNGVTFNEVDEKIKSSSVLVHTFGLATNSTDKTDKKESEEALKVLGSFARASHGVHTVLGYNDQTESDYAKEIADYINNLYLTRFVLTNFKEKGGSYNLRILFATTGEKGDVFEAEGIINIPNQEKITDPVATFAPSKEGISNIGGEATTEVMNKNTSEKSVFWSVKLFGLPIHLLILFVLLILLGTMVLMILKKQHHKKETVSSERGIFMKAEILSENCMISKYEFYLSKELIIGRDRDCDIKLPNKDISLRNSRLFVRDNVVYIEDLNSTNGTAINDMKIFSPNKLRSGDIISIGSVYFVLKF